MRARVRAALACGCLTIGLLSACGDGESTNPGQPQLAKELVFYDWDDDIPQSVLDAFTQEYGVKIIYPTYQTSEEAIEHLREGEGYDVMVIDSQFIPKLVADGLIAEIDFRNVPNFKNLSVNFRDLVFDPGNRYSITYSWGLMGLIMRGDLVASPASRWVDLWDPRFAGEAMVWDLPRYLIGIALKSLEFSINSESPVELEAALQRLLALKAQVRTATWAPEVSEWALASGEVTLMYGWAGDVLRARARNLDIRYVVPPQGSIQWSDNFVIAAASPNKFTAEVFINFLLRSEISARITNELFYATGNEQAYPLIKPEIRNNPVIFPTIEDIRRSEVVLPLSQAGQALHERIWGRYLSGTAGSVTGGE